jgi:hypothetical protein
LLGGAPPAAGRSVRRTQARGRAEGNSLESIADPLSS